VGDEVCSFKGYMRSLYISPSLVPLSNSDFVFRFRVNLRHEKRERREMYSKNWG
jgi:hypothetical protein